MKSMKIIINAEVGLHARPASLFCALAGKFESEIEIRNITTESDFVNAKSILSVLTLGVMQGHEVEITASGDDENEAVEKIEELILNDFPDEV